MNRKQDPVKIYASIRIEYLDLNLISLNRAQILFQDQHFQSYSLSFLAIHELVFVQFHLILTIDFVNTNLQDLLVHQTEIIILYYVQYLHQQHTAFIINLNSKLELLKTLND